MINRLSAIFVFVLATSANAATLIEWDLPADSAPVQIDGQHSGRQTFFFLDLGHSSINRVSVIANGIALHDEWRPSSFKGANPGTLEVDDTTGRVWVTDPPNGAIGMLDPATDMYMWWRVQDVTGLPPVALAVDKVTQTIWFTSYDGVSTPIIAHLDPQSGTVSWGLLPASIADVNDALDGIVSPSPEQIYFSVVGPGRGAITHLFDDLIFKFRFTTWNIPLSEPGQIALTNNGQIAAALDNASGKAMLLDPGADQFTWWQDGLALNSLTRWLSVPPGRDDVFFLGDTGPCITWLDPSGGASISVPPFKEIRTYDIDSVGYDQAVSPKSSTMLSPIISYPTLDGTFAPFAHISPITKLGAISVVWDVTGAPNMFITETNVSRVAFITL